MNRVIINFFVLAVTVSMIMLNTGCSGKQSGNYVNAGFVSSDSSAVVYETSDKNISFGKYQKDISELSEDYTEFDAGSIVSVSSSEDFEKGVKAFKEKLDILESEYAFGYTGENADYVKVKIDDKRLGLAVFALLNSTSQYDCKMVSEMGDLEVFGYNFNYEADNAGSYKIYVETKPSTADRTNLKEYIENNSGSNLYLTIGDLTFSHAVIDGSFNEEKVVFSGLDFIGTQASDDDYGFIMELAKYSVNNPGEGLYTMNFPDEAENGETYSIPYITLVDEDVIAKLNTLYSDASFERIGIDNKIEIRLNIDPQEVKDGECVDRVAEIYTGCGFDNGAYSSVSFTWPKEKESHENDYVIFTKKDGKMVCTGKSEDIKPAVNLHPVLGEYTE